MTKIEFITALETVKKRLPVGIVPLYVTAWPEAAENLSRVKNTVAGKIQDEKILSNLEALADHIEKI